VRNAREQQQLIICWQDGTEHRLLYGQLRAACRCASCRAQLTSGRIQLIAADIALEKINNLGQGLQFIFSDGHQRGIFPWQYLYELRE
jgi:DUF971 family protein